MEWISVEDRLPEEGAVVLVSERYEDFAYIARWLGDGWVVPSGPYMCRGDCPGPEIDCPANIIHWMPLPALPKDPT